MMQRLRARRSLTQTAPLLTTTHSLLRVYQYILRGHGVSVLCKHLRAEHRAAEREEQRVLDQRARRRRPRHHRSRTPRRAPEEAVAKPRVVHVLPAPSTAVSGCI